MKVYILVLALLLVSGCVSSYRSPLPQDPLYTQDIGPKEALKGGAEGYTRVERAYKDDTSLKPKEGETYEEYSQRVDNTIKLQEYKKQELQKAIESKNKEIDSLLALQRDLLLQNVDLRMSIGQIITIKVQEEGSDKLFRPYVIQRGDTLQRIAQDKYGSYTAWLAIYRFNRERLVNGPNRIEEGEVLYLPDANEAKAIEIHKQFVDSK